MILSLGNRERLICVSLWFAFFLISSLFFLSLVVIMEKLDVPQPIQAILDGHNYILWAQAMLSFLRDENFGVLLLYCKTYWQWIWWEICYCLEDWDSQNYQIIIWFRNISVPTINLKFGWFDIAKSLWDFLARRYTATNFYTSTNCYIVCI